MVETPWGSTETLRERRLRPSRATPAEEVARNQRERLFAATVAVVAEKGYEATRVADLLALSGVSRASFYEHFGDKEDCFLATLEALVRPALEWISKAARRSDGEGAREALEAIVSVLHAQPAIARFCFVEVHSAGPAAMAAVERTFDAFVSISAEALSQQLEGDRLPDPLVRAIVGGCWQVMHRRISRGTTDELDSLVPQLLQWTRTYRPPPQPLRPPRRRTSARQTRPSDHLEEAERILHAFSEVVCERNFAETTVTAVAERASCSLSTFYSHFPGKEEAMLAALDSAFAQMLAAVLPAFRRGADWPHSISHSMQAMLAFGAAEPAYAQLAIVEAFAAGRRALEQHDVLTRELESLLAPGFELAPDAPAIAPEAIAGAVSAILYEHVRHQGTATLPTLGPLCTYIALSPFVGPERACIVANRDGRAGHHHS